MNEGRHQEHLPSAALGKARRAVWIAYVVLLLFLVASGIAHYVQQHAQLAALLVRILPLVLFLPTLLLARRRGHIWLAVVGLLYVMQGILIVSKGAGSALVILEILAAMSLTIAAFRYARLRGRYDRAAS